MMERKKIFFVNPTGLKGYDQGLLSNLPCKEDVIYYCNIMNEDVEGLSDIRRIFNYNSHKNKYISGISYVLSLIRLFADVLIQKPKLIHIEWIKLFKIDYWFLCVLKKLKYSVVHTVHNTLPHDDVNRVHFDIFKKYYKEVDALIVHAKNTKEELINNFGIDADKINIIKHGILDLKVDENKIKDIISNTINEYTLDGKIIFSLLGNQSKYKGYDLVEEVWSTNPNLRDNDNVCLLIAGKSRNVNTERLSKIKNVITINRLLTDEEFMAYLDLSSVVLLPYTRISQSGILLTAISRNAPVLVSDVGGLAEPLEIAHIGWNIGEPKPSNLLKTFNIIIDNPFGVFDIKNDIESWNKVKQEYSWVAISKQTQELYSDKITK